MKQAILELRIEIGRYENTVHKHAIGMNSLQIFPPDFDGREDEGYSAIGNRQIK